MKVIAAFAVIVISAPQGCRLDAIDRADFEVIDVESKEECERVAEMIDRRQDQRGLCREAVK